MKKRGKVLKLFESHVGKSERVECSSLKLDEDGVLNDKFYAKDRERSILISSIESYTLAAKNDVTIQYGDLGENIVVDFNPYHFPENYQFQIGEVILEISQHCTLCKSLAKIDSKLPKLLKNDRGIFAKVIKLGMIYNDSTVTYEV